MRKTWLLFAGLYLTLLQGAGDEKCLFNRHHVDVLVARGRASTQFGLEAHCSSRCEDFVLPHVAPQVCRSLWAEAWQLSG